MNTTHSDDSGIRFRVLSVTPEMATEWLGKNHRNRTLSDGTVASYAHDMKQGRWDMNGSTIVFDSHGHLVDGQHRLEAVVRAGVPVRLLVVENVDEQAKLSIDGALPRRHADRFQMFGQVKRGGRVAAALSMIEQAVWDKHDRLSSHLLWERYVAYKPGFDWAQHAITLGFMLNAPIYGALVLGFGSYRDAVIEFAYRLQEGIGLRRYEPAWALRNFLMAQGAHPSPAERRATFYKTLRCIRAAADGERITRLCASRDVVTYFVPELAS